MSTATEQASVKQLQAEFEALARSASPGTVSTVLHVLGVIAFGSAGEKAHANELCSRLIAGQLSPAAFAAEVSRLPESARPNAAPVAVA